MCFHGNHQTILQLCPHLEFKVNNTIFYAIQTAVTTVHLKHWTDLRSKQRGDAARFSKKRCENKPCHQELPQFYQKALGRQDSQSPQAQG